ncbi:hypothetical protein C1637_22015 [Chryseobacterium lactis]|uniref:NUMOD4 domain-containing protein n=1 Tax=Chryseobacterium lactis TaxID=1241981 RepID=A0A3G6RTZ4_CHRLC|nr:NUMOD4 domain-containing protein [Chryseobacterium lactis]AZA84958.1 hypothetical protein EG342_24975 [Chryseobacterium lactis]AZB05346.1 hypothetical protein EG341_15855 [Chryseobacterium lactis]PNW11495.1 hypothetical protein C1637_22015 [Chryseobacterium lactis]
MKLPIELGDKYINTVLSNFSLENLSGEKWKWIEDFENYAISNYGRIKSLERWVATPNGGMQKLSDRILKPQAFRYFNKYLNTHFYNVRCNLCVEGKIYGKSVARLVYYHFVEKFDMDDLSFRMSFKDDNRFNVHFSNLEKLTANKVRSKALNKGRGKKGNYQQTVSQYTVEGDFVATYENIYAASESLGISPPHILAVINRKRTTAGKFRWFAKDYTLTKEDFIPETKSKPEKALNIRLWKRLGQPPIDENNPPACMNLLLKTLPGESWQPLPNLEQYFEISNKGRVKRLNSWTQNRNKTFWKEHIISLFVHRSDSEKYFLYTKLSCNGKSYTIAITRMLYYCFIEKFDLKNRNLVIVNGNDSQWDIDILKLSLQSINDILTERNKTKIRKILNSKKVFNDSLWEKLNRPRINMKNPPAILDLSLRDLPDEYWKPLPGFGGKYVISNKGRIKRLSGWTVGTHFYEEDQILSLCLKKAESPYLYFRLHAKEDINPKVLTRILYFCFVEEFDLNNRTLRIVNENESLLDIDLSKLSLRFITNAFNKKEK